jgi:hypothetical protein
MRRHPSPGHCPREQPFALPVQMNRTTTAAFRRCELASRHDEAHELFQRLAPWVERWKSAAAESTELCRCRTCPRDSKEYRPRTQALKMAPEVGLEPTTPRLTAACSTIELLWNPEAAQLTDIERDRQTGNCPSRKEKIEPAGILLRVAFDSGQSRGARAAFFILPSGPGGLVLLPGVGERCICE